MSHTNESPHSITLTILSVITLIVLLVSSGLVANKDAETKSNEIVLVSNEYAIQSFKDPAPIISVPLAPAPAPAPIAVEVPSEAPEPIIQTPVVVNTPAPVAPVPTTVQKAPAPFVSANNLPAKFAQLRQCESGNNYSINTGNGYYGAYQFNQSTWASVGGSGLPSNASPAEQDARALTLYNQRGWQPWTCAQGF